MKRMLILNVMIWFILLLFSGCHINPSHSSSDNGKLQIVTTIFPAYDFVRQVAGEFADVTLLLKPGTEAHTYEPSPADIIALENCDLFVFNGGESDTWIREILDGGISREICTLKMMDCVDELREEEAVEGMQHPGREHEHDSHVHVEHHHGYGEISYDEHVWTSPVNASLIVTAIEKKLTAIDPLHTSVYAENAHLYREKLQQLDREFRTVTEQARYHTIIFGDRFPFLYFAQEYGLKYYAAFPGCSSAAEPSAKTVAYLIDQVKKDEVPVVFYIEFSNQKIVRALEDETGAKPLLFHSCHNITKDEMQQNITYLDLMNNNVKNLWEALN